MNTEYPKIDTLFERDPTTFVVDPTKLKKPVFGTVKEWDVTEKVDGTNIRVLYSPGFSSKDSPIRGDCAPSVEFRGRSDNANTPGDLLQALAKLFPPEKFTNLFQTSVTLYGEGYGAGIQKVGKLYRPDKSFILFDVLIHDANGQDWWLDTPQVQEIAKSLEIDAVPYWGRFTLDQIVAAVRSPSPSSISIDCLSEGIVARPIETLFDKRHERVILKLKTKDFQPGKR